MGDKPYPWTKEIEDEILSRIARGQSVVDICDDEWLPSQATLYRRLADDKEFSERYTRAREVQADTLFDEILQIADDGRNDWMSRKDEGNAGYVENGEALRRSEIRINARKWMAGKLRPKKYGEKLELGGTGEGGALNIVVRQFTVE
jgi:hypothetical protein